MAFPYVMVLFYLVGWCNEVSKKWLMDARPMFVLTGAPLTSTASAGFRYQVFLKMQHNELE